MRLPATWKSGSPLTARVAGVKSHSSASVAAVNTWLAWRCAASFGAPVLRDYYDVEIEGGDVYRLFQDLCTESWFVDARYE